MARSERLHQRRVRRQDCRSMKAALRLLADEEPVEQLDLVVGVEQAVPDHALIPDTREAPKRLAALRERKRRHCVSRYRERRRLLNVSLSIREEKEMVGFQ